MKVGIIGAGVMGRGIAQVSASAGHQVVLFEINNDVLQTAKASIAANLHYSNRITDVNVDLIIEAIVEKLEVKVSVLSQLAEINGPTTVYASNTSSIPLTQIAANFAYPTQVVGIHYFNPAHIMKLVEVISAEQTSPEVLKIAKEQGYCLPGNKVMIFTSD